MRSRLFGMMLLGLGAVGCGPVGKPYAYPLDGVLRLDEVQVKGTHNSYHVETTTGIPEWHYTMAPLEQQLDRQGVRQIELDLNWLTPADGAPRIDVYHVDTVDAGTTCLHFRDCLAAVRGWSARFPGHLPIYIQLEPKPGIDAGEMESFFTTLERDILSVFPRDRIITPDEVQGEAATLPAALAVGWPTLDRLRGRVLFAFDNRQEVRAAYTHGLADLHGRLAFVDSDPSDPFGAVSILNDPSAQMGAIEAALAAHLLVRTQADSDGVQARASDYHTLDAALGDGASFISTDFPVPVPDAAYVVSIPDGTPARCNPITASPSCTSLALEDPRFVGSVL
jgi:hypothetical protein